MSGKSGDASSEEAAAVLQLLQAQGAMQTLLLDGYTWAFKQCTTTGSGPQLSAKEKRCIAQGVSTYVEARSHVGQSVQGQGSELS